LTIQATDFGSQIGGKDLWQPVFVEILAAQFGDLTLVIAQFSAYQSRTYAPPPMFCGFDIGQKKM